MGASQIPSSTSSSSVVRVVVSCARVLVFSFFFLLTLEVATRVEHRIKYDTPVLSRYSYDAVLYAVDEFGIRGRPNATFEKWQLNSFGFRGPEFNLQRPPGKLRIGCIGASETFGLYEQAGNEWPRQLERFIQERGIKAEVLNAALAGMSLPQRLNHFRNRLSQLRPDVLILMLEYTSYAGLTPSKVEKRRQTLTVPLPQARDDVLDGLKSLRLLTALRYSLPPKLPSFIQQLVSDFDLYLKLRLRQRELGGDFRSFRQVTQLEVDSFRRDLEDFVKVASQNNVRLVLASPALWLNERNVLLFYTSWPYVDESWLRQAQTTFTQAANRIALEYDLPFIDLSTIMAGREPALMKDMVHYSDEGAAVVGRVIAHSVAMDLNRLQKQASNL